MMISLLQEDAVQVPLIAAVEEVLEAEEVGVTDGPLHGGDGLVDLGEGELAASWGWALVGKLVAAFG